METQTFDGLDIRPEVLEVLGKLNFTTPTPIQKQAIPVAIAGNDVIGIAQTGTGKTLAFGIPAIQRLMASNQIALMILPTRELALQVDESLSKIANRFNLRSAVLIGGANMNKQMHDLKAGPRIIISTPGRLIDHLERGTVKLDRVGVLVLDEADRMLDMGFEPQVKRILQSVPKERQTMLFSATMPQQIVSIADRYMKTPLRVEVAPAGSAADSVTHEIYFVRDNCKLALLDAILKEKHGSILVFSRTKHGAKRIAFAIRKMGHTSTEIHSNRSLAQRVAALDGFKKGKFKVMVATDIAARGIDVKGIEVVINYDLPDSPEDYVHRIGRTGRADALGHAISFATPKQTYDIRIIEKLIKKTLPVSKLPENMVINPAILEGSNERDERGNGGRRPERRSDSSSRGRSASGSRYGNRPRFGNSGSVEKRAEENPRRGFLPKRTDSRQGERSNVTPLQKGKEFYKEFNDSIFSDTPERKRANAPQGDRNGSRPFGRSNGGNRGFSDRGNRKAPVSSNFDQLPQRRMIVDEEGQQDSYIQEPFMNADKDPAYRKPFGPFKPRVQGGKGNGNRRSSSRTPFSRAPRKASVHSSGHTASR